MESLERTPRAFAEALANRMVLRITVGALARMANPQDPRDFISHVEQLIAAQLDTGRPVVAGLSDDQDRALKALIREEVADIMNHLKFGDD